jgi:hypothetical protein
LHDEVSPERPNLIEQGWHPGVVFSAPGASYSLNQLTEEGGYEEVCNFVLSEDDRLVLISHECDIVSRDELYVEALVCHVVNPNESKLIQWDRNSARRFVVDFDTAYVADATKRLKILKRDLPTANDGSPMDDERRRRFVDWLGARYIRPVVPDNLASDFVNPVRELFRRWTKRNKDPEERVKKKPWRSCTSRLEITLRPRSQSEKNSSSMAGMRSPTAISSRRWSSQGSIT